MQCAFLASLTASLLTSFVSITHITHSFTHVTCLLPCASTSKESSLVLSFKIYHTLILIFFILIFLCLFVCLFVCVMTLPLLLVTFKEYRLSMHPVHCNWSCAFVSQTMIRIPLYVMGRNPELFEDPLEYKPERWLRDDTHKSPYHAFGFLPFGFGTRMCLGKCIFVHWNLPESFCENQLESSEGNRDNLWATSTRHRHPELIGTLRSDDGDGNGNATKAIGLISMCNQN